MTDHKPKYAGKIVGGVLIIIIAILAWSLLKEKDEIVGLVDKDLASTQDSADEVIDAQNYEYMKVNDWEFYDNALADIQSLKAGQIISYNIIRDPLHTNIVYFSSENDNEMDPDNEANVLTSIYIYDESDYSFERIWKGFYQSNSSVWNGVDPFMPALRIIGYENGSLILSITDANQATPLCFEPYLLGFDGAKEIVTLDLSDPYSGFYPYIPPKDIVDQAQKRENNCRQ